MTKKKSTSTKTKKSTAAKTKKSMSAKASKAVSKLKSQQIAKTGLTSRVRGHVSARGKRAQGRRDSR
jgi:hypothetical protein